MVEKRFNNVYHIKCKDYEVSKKEYINGVYNMLFTSLIKVEFCNLLDSNKLLSYSGRTEFNILTTALRFHGLCISFYNKDGDRLYYDHESHKKGIKRGSHVQIFIDFDFEFTDEFKMSAFKDNHLSMKALVIEYIRESKLNKLLV